MKTDWNCNSVVELLPHILLPQVQSLVWGKVKVVSLHCMCKK